jgi:hypothetical protein
LKYIDTAAAALMGLLFVAVSIHIDDFHNRTSADLHLFAALAFNCFFYVLLLSIFFLVPNLSLFGPGIPLLIFGIPALAKAFVQQRRARRAHGRNPQAGSRFNLPVVSLIALMLASIGMRLHIGPSLYELVLVVVLH